MPGIVVTRPTGKEYYSESGFRKHAERLLKENKHLGPHSSNARTMHIDDLVNLFPNARINYGQYEDERPNFRRRLNEAIAEAGHRGSHRYRFKRSSY